MKKKIKIAVSLVLHNEAVFIPRLAEALKRQTFKPSGIYVTDNSSDDDSAALIKELLPDAFINLSPDNPGYGKAHNQNMKRAFADGADAIFILNTDTEPDNDFLASTVQLLASGLNPGIISPLILYGEGDRRTTKVQSFRIIANLKNAKVKNIDNKKDLTKTVLPEYEQANYFSGTACVITKEVYEAVGGFEENNFLYGEEMDYSYRASLKGIKIIALRDAKIWHYHDWSKKNIDGLCKEYYLINRNKIRFFKKFNLKKGLYGFLANETVMSPLRIKWAMKKGGNKLVDCFYRGIIHGLKEGSPGMPESKPNPDSPDFVVCVINTSGNYGGAEKRIVSLFEHISKERNDFMLIINRALYDLMREKGILLAHPRISVIDIPFDKKNIGTEKRGANTTAHIRKQNRIKNAPGKYKYLLKTAYQRNSFSKQLKEILKKNRIKTVYTIWQGGIWGRLTFKSMKVKIIYGANSNLVWHLEKGLLSRFDSQYRILRDADHVDFLSEGLVKELRELMPPGDFPKKYSISPCSFINYENFRPQYPKENSVVFMGRLVKLKNPLLFLEAVKIFNSAYDEHKEITFFVLGAGPEEAAMRRYAQKHDLNNVMFEGKVSRPEKYLQKSKIFISIQQTENYPGQALMEAMACENAIIASDVGETRKMVTEKEGELVKLDAKEIAKTLVKLISNENDLIKKGKNAREKVMREHTIEKFTEYFYSLFENG